MKDSEQNKWKDCSYFDSLYPSPLCPSTNWILSVDCTSVFEQADYNYSMTAHPDFHHERSTAGWDDPGVTILCQQCWKEASDLKHTAKESTVVGRSQESFEMLGQDLHKEPTEPSWRFLFSDISVGSYWWLLTTDLMTRMAIQRCGCHLFSFHLLAQDLKITPKVLLFCAPPSLHLVSLTYPSHFRSNVISSGKVSMIPLFKSD